MDDVSYKHRGSLYKMFPASPVVDGLEDAETDNLVDVLDETEVDTWVEVLENTETNSFAEELEAAMDDTMEADGMCDSSPEARAEEAPREPASTP